MPKWRNWQTRKFQVFVGASLWGFDSPLRHFSLFIHDRIKR